MNRYCYNNRLRRQSGFTLIELLISIFIFAIVVSSVYGAYRATFHTVQGTEQRVILASSARVILERVSEDLDYIYTGEEGALIGEEAEVEGKRVDTLSLVTTAHVVFTGSAKEKGLAEVKYSLEEQGDTGLFLLYRSDTLLLPGVSDEENNKVLLGKGIRSFKITYLGNGGDEQDNWRSTSEEPEDSDEKQVLNLPTLIRIAVELSVGAEDEFALFRTAVAMPVINKDESDE